MRTATRPSSGSSATSQAEKPAKFNATPGLTLRRLRLARGWTLEELSRRTPFTVSVLSKLERGKLSLSYDKLVALAEGMGIDISELFDAQPPQVVAATSVAAGRRSVCRAGDEREVHTQAYTHRYPAAELLNKHFVPMIVEHHARTLAEFGELIRHPGEEFCYVIEGAVTLHTDLYEPLELAVGDSVYFDSRMGHAYLAAADGPCRALSICSGGREHSPDALPIEPEAPATHPRKPQVTRSGRISREGRP